MKRYHVDGGIPALEIALSEYMKVDELKMLAGLTRKKLPARKADIAAVITRHLAGEGLRKTWQCLDELQRAAVAEVVHSSSTRYPAERFYAKYGRDPDWGALDKYGRHLRQSTLGFFFYGNGVMPADLKARLEAFVPPPVEAKIKSLAELPAAYDRPFTRWNSKTRTQEQGTEKVLLTVRETGRAAQLELVSVLRLVDAGKVGVGAKTKRPSSAAIEAVTRVLEGGDCYPRLPVKDRLDDENAGPIRAFAWPLLIQTAGLARLSGSKLQLTRTGRKALGEPATETIRRLWVRWVDTTILDELSRIDCVKGQTGKGKRGLTAVSGRRRAVADSLARCPVGGWVSTDEFFRFVRASGNDFSVTRSAWNLYVGELQYGSLGHDNGQHILEARYLFCLLLEYAATLGMIDVALIPPADARRDYHGMWGTDDLPYFSRYDGLMYFRVTPLGAYSLGVASDHEPAPVEVRPVLRVLPNLEIAAIGGELEQGDRLGLDAYATRVSDLVWRLDAGKLLAAIEGGRPLVEIREFLAARNGGAIPGTVARLLEDVADRSTKVRDRGLARLIECADPALAALIANDSRTRKHCMHAGERHLVVSAASEAVFRRTLREVGYILAMGETRPAKSWLPTPPAGSAPQATED